MRLGGKRRFQASSEKVFNAILNPSVLQSCVPNCQSVEYLDADHLNVQLTTPLPGLKGPYSVVIQIVKRQTPNLVVLAVHRKGTGGSMDGTCDINVTDEADGSLLTYSVMADLEGPIAIVSNPVGEGIVRALLNSFFKRIDTYLG